VKPARRRLTPQHHGEQAALCEWQRRRRTATRPIARLNIQAATSRASLESRKATSSQFGAACTTVASGVNETHAGRTHSDLGGTCTSNTAGTKTGSLRRRCAAFGLSTRSKPKIRSYLQSRAASPCTRLIRLKFMVLHRTGSGYSGSSSHVRLLKNTQTNMLALPTHGREFLLRFPRT
jgi:hypothetical protein